MTFIVKPSILPLSSSFRELSNECLERLPPSLPRVGFLDPPSFVIAHPMENNHVDGEREAERDCGWMGERK